MLVAQVAKYVCKYCNKGFDEGRRLGGHVRQAHPPESSGSSESRTFLPFAEGELAARVFEMWKERKHPDDIIVALRVHPRFVREVFKEYGELLNEWKKCSEASTPSPRPSNSETTPSKGVDVEW